MATLQKYIDRAMRLNGVDTAQYPLTTAVEDANVVYHQVEDYITSAIGEGFFWDILTEDETTVGQSEYPLPILTDGQFNGALKVESISIKYDTEFVKATQVARETLSKDLTYYETSQSPSNPIYFIADNSLFIYPAPTKAVVKGLKMYGIKTLADITATTTEAEMFGGKIPLKYYYIISDGMGQFIRRIQGQTAEAEQLRQIFDKETLRILVDNLGNRRVGVIERGMPDLSCYK